MHSMSYDLGNMCEWLNASIDVDFFHASDKLFTLLSLLVHATNRSQLRDEFASKLGRGRVDAKDDNGLIMV